MIHEGFAQQTKKKNTTHERSISLKTQDMTHVIIISTTINLCWFQTTTSKQFHFCFKTPSKMGVTQFMFNSLIFFGAS